MSVTPSTGGVDLLTRTTLQINGSMSTMSLAHLIQTLQRVPGVLFAEVDAADGRATIAHDAGVPTASLLAAATGAGVHARLVAGLLPLSMRADAASCLKDKYIRRLLMIGVAVFVTATLVEILVPNSLEKHWLLPVLMISVWAFILLAKAFGPHRA